jgi:hypothetical protein
MLNRLSEARIDAILRDGTAHVLHRDYETRSPIRLSSVGTHRYAADPRTEVLCCAYAVDDGPVQLWTPGDPEVPPEFIEAPRDPAWVVAAHGDHFETAIEQHRSNLPETAKRRHRQSRSRRLMPSLMRRSRLPSRALPTI